MDVQPSPHLVLLEKTGRLFGKQILNLLLSSLINNFISALSEVVGQPLPYDDVMSVRDRLWEISPSLIRYDVTEKTSADLASLGLKTLAAINKSATVSGLAFRKPITNFYQTDPISRA